MEFIEDAFFLRLVDSPAEPLRRCAHTLDPFFFAFPLTVTSLPVRPPSVLVAAPYLLLGLVLLLSEFVPFDSAHFSSPASRSELLDSSADSEGEPLAGSWRFGGFAATMRYCSLYFPTGWERLSCGHSHFAEISMFASTNGRALRCRCLRPAYSLEFCLSMSLSSSSTFFISCILLDLPLFF